MITKNYELLDKHIDNNFYTLNNHLFLILTKGIDGYFFVSTIISILARNLYSLLLDHLIILLQPLH